MEELIARLEQATGPDIELEGAIHKVVCGTVDNAPLYMASIDAALTLVPYGFQAYVDTGITGDGDAHACVWTEHPRRIQGGARQVATPAIALCIAALRARGQGA